MDVEGCFWRFLRLLPFSLWWVLGALLRLMPFRVGAVPDPGSHICRGWLTLPFLGIGAKATNFQIGQTHKQTGFRPVGFSIITWPDFCLSSITVMTSRPLPFTGGGGGRSAKGTNFCVTRQCWLAAGATELLSPEPSQHQHLPPTPRTLPNLCPPSAQTLCLSSSYKISLLRLNKIAKAIRLTYQRADCKKVVLKKIEKCKCYKRASSDHQQQHHHQCGKHTEETVFILRKQVCMGDCTQTFKFVSGACLLCSWNKKSWNQFPSASDKMVKYFCRRKLWEAWI